ncbi:SbcC/MukB-like Walker B domain-containing protein [Micromonospora sp. HUAS YX12]|uniref:SbcC/MukB-like Walker B domain-containing protein n=1 Tax=Micromonospora sp. HUAS YX12 TaxID=3156396 RepID=A0AAU7QV31_9ACTN
MSIPLQSVRARPDAEIGTQQWRVESLQLVNWGGFEGHHTIAFAETATLISGASGTGKSTLLDAYVALMMDSNTPFNGASNDAVTGRARSSEQRNILSYMRGKVDTSREAGTGRLRDDVLRGQHSSTWSAVAMTWRNDADERFTALRLYYAAVSAISFNDLGKHLATINGPFELSLLDPFAGDRFIHQQVTKRFPGLKFHDGYTQFAAALHTRLGIGANGDGAKALKLLARIQAGRQVTTVDGLYKDMVLEEPKTFTAANRAVEHFDDIQASYNTMKTAEKQVAVLDGILPAYQAMTEAREEADLIESLRIESTDANTPFLLWARQVEAALLTQAIIDNRARNGTIIGRLTAAQARQTSLQAEIADLQEQQRANGGDALEALERSISVLNGTVTAVEQTLSTFRQRTAVLERGVTSSEEFDALRADSGTFLATFEQHRLSLQQQRDKTLKDAHPLQTGRDKLQREFDSLKGRTGLVPHDLHAQRLALAQAMNLQAEDLPFVAELIDMAPQFEAWREAAELALGGFAVTMLIDERRLDEARRRVNPLRFDRRVRFEGVRLNEPTRRTPSPDTLPGRFVTRETPLTGWLLNTLMTRFGYDCIDNPDLLDYTDFGLTITGQTKERRRGAHGGHGARRVIGFSNRHRLAQIVDEQKGIDKQLGELARLKIELEARSNRLHAERDAHNHVIITTWASIDVGGVREEIKEKERAYQRLLAASDVLRELKQQENELAGQLENVQRDVFGDEKEQEQLGKTHEKLLEDQAKVSAHLQDMQGDPSATLTEPQSARLQATRDGTGFDETLDGFRRSVEVIKTVLADASERARREAAGHERLLCSTFKRFQEQWPRPNLGDGVDSYDGYREILTDLLEEGLHERRAKFSRQVSDWSGVDLLRLHGAYEESVEEIEARLEPVNDILSRLPFGAGRDRLHINLRRREAKDIAKFRKELKVLASGTTETASDAEIEARFERLRKFIDRIRKSDKSSQREYLIDVRKHVDIDAERRDTTGRQLSVYASLGGKSGGETQELVAFIVGAALRYQLGDASLTRPRYAPVFLDEGFVKSDAEFAGRAVAAWKGLGFQLIVGAPNDKVTAIEPYVDLLLQVTKNNSNYSHVSSVRPTTRTPRMVITDEVA